MKTGRKLLSLLLCFVLLLAMMPAVFAEGDAVTTEAALRDAVAAGGEIVLGADITIMSPVSITNDVTIDGGGHTIDYPKAFFDGLLHVDGGASLTLKNIIIDEEDALSDGMSPVIRLNGSDANLATLTLGEGAVIRNSKTYYGTISGSYSTINMAKTAQITNGAGVGIWADHCTVNMEGTISNYRIIGIRIDRGSTLNMYEGEILGIYSEGVLAGDDCTFNMYGGSICNIGAFYGGETAIRLQYGSGATVNIFGGKISGNNSRNGTITVGRGCSLNMYGGEISGNTAAEAGGGVYVEGGTFRMTGGTITGNSAPYGGGVFVQAYNNIYYGKDPATAVITDAAAIYGNSAAQYGDDLVVDGKGYTSSLTLTAENLDWFYDGAGDPDGADQRYDEVTYCKEYTQEELTLSDALALKAVYTPPVEDNTPALGLLGGLLPILGQQLTPFVDVNAASYCYDAVNWVVENGITTGTGRLTFSPDAPCTRAEAVTFLWRAAGCPEPKAAAQFTDIDANAYYAKAVAWAVENGITNGTSDTTFSPAAVCTRGQIVTFLCRAFGEASAAATPFTDVAADAYYAGAVSWAAANGVTGGTSDTTFSPAAVCTRAQIVTFLYRCFN